MNYHPDLYIPIGPVDNHCVVDEFTFTEVRETHCVASVSENISNYLIDTAITEKKKYLTVCIPAYNEEFEEMLKTLVSLMESIEYMQRKVKLL